jgi:multidrug efflux pump subunit AcrA (membrane-fusion protein)
VKFWRQKSLLINLSLTVILVAVGITSYLEIRPASQSTALATSTVQRGTVLATVSASGTLEAAQDLGLNFTTGGKVTAIYVKVGQRVSAGQKLAKVAPTASDDTLNQAQAQLASAEAQRSAAAEGETPQAKKVQSDQAASAQQQVQVAESNLSAAETSADDDATSAEQSVTTAQDNLSYAQQTQTNDEEKHSTDEAALNASQNQLNSYYAAEAAACAGSTTGTGAPNPTPSTTSGTSSGCATDQAAVATDKTAVSGDTSAVSSDTSAIQGAQQTVTGDQNAVASAQDSEKTTEDHDKATITSDKEAVSSAQKSYQTTLDSNTESATPNSTTIAQDAASVTNDEVVVQEDQQTLAGTTLTAPFAGTVASISSDVGEVVSSSGAGGSASSSTASSTTGSSGSSGSGSSSSSSSSSSSGEAAGTGAAGAGTGAGGAGTSNTASGFIVLTNLSNMVVQATFDEYAFRDCGVEAGGRGPVAGGHQIVRACSRGNRPAMGAQPVDHFGSFSLVEQVPGLGDVFAAQLNCGLAVLFGLFLAARETLCAEELIGERFNGDTAAGLAERLDPVEQQVLGVGGQVRQQALRRPRRGNRGVKPGLHQGFRPVLTQVDADTDMGSDRVDRVRFQGAGLELHHLGLVDFVDHASVRPGEPPGA